VQKVPNLALSQ